MTANNEPRDALDELRSLKPVGNIVPLQSSNTNESQGATATTAGAYMVSRLASEIEVKPPEFIWEGWIEKGALHVLAGRQGAGKSTWLAHIAARLSRGEGDPLLGLPPNAPLMIGWLSFEETESKIVGRLTAMGANLNQIRCLGDVGARDEDGNELPERRHQWRMPRDTYVIESQIIRDGINLLVIDGFGYSVESGGGEPGYSITGQALSGLKGVAERTGCAVIGLTHMSKGGGEAANAAIGSVGWMAIPRIGWVLNIDKENEKLRLVGVPKSGWKDPDCTYSFEITDDPMGSKMGLVTNIRPSDVKPNEISTAWKADDERGVRGQVKEFILESLRHGDKFSDEMKKEAIVELGVSETTYTRACNELASKKDPNRPVNRGKLGMAGPWILHLIRDDERRSLGAESEPSEDGHGAPLTASRGNSGDNDNLCPEQEFSPSPPKIVIEDSHAPRSDHLREGDHLREPMLTVEQIEGPPLTDDERRALRNVGVAVQ